MLRKYSTAWDSPATSITAFVGRALRGPLDEPVTIHDYGGFERIFGGLWIDGPMSYAVRDFYLNGGARAIVVRVDNGAGTAVLPLDDLTLTAANPGSWGNRLEVEVDHEVSAAAGVRLGLPADSQELFNLKVLDGSTGDTEEFRNLTVVDSARRIDRVLEQESHTVRASLGSAATRPGAQPVQVAEPDLVSDGEPPEKPHLIGSASAKTGLHALEKADLFNLLCIPHDVGGIWEDAAAYCQKRRAVLIIDPPASWTSKDDAKTKVGEVGVPSQNAALFFPRLRQPNPLRDSRSASSCGPSSGSWPGGWCARSPPWPAPRPGARRRSWP